MTSQFKSAGRWLVFLAFVLPAYAKASVGTPAYGQKPAEPVCNSCHDQGKKLEHSAHASVNCATCHPRHEEVPHPAGISKPSCAQCHQKVAAEHARSVHGMAVKRGNAAAPDCAVCHGDVHEVAKATSFAFRKSVPEICGACHSEIADEFRKSVHGRAVTEGIPDAPVCTTCHGEHSILAPTNAASPVHPSHIRETCGQCHGNAQLSRRFGLPPDRVVSFDASYHGLAAKGGSETVANCASCHGVHNILPSADPRSTVNPKNLASTCGRCHAGAGRRFALGPVHQLPGEAEPKAVRWVRVFYLIVIPLTIGGMFLHNLGDWTRKLARRKFARFPGAEGLTEWKSAGPPRRAGETRMYGFERLEHALLAISFVVLAWTGFALKYPEGWWARPLLVWEASWPVRETLHRIAAVIFIAVAILHLASLVTSARLRRHWQALWPRRGDSREALLNLAYNLGLRSVQPERSENSYVEKIEYWALVWGTVVMVVTGIMLWAHNFFLARLPKSALDFATAVHLYEAVLATLAVLVWHFYSVIFDPDVYPMDTSWLTGRSVDAHGEEQKNEPEALETGPEGPPHESSNG